MKTSKFFTDKHKNTGSNYLVVYYVFRNKHAGDLLVFVVGVGPDIAYGTMTFLNHLGTGLKDFENL